MTSATKGQPQAAKLTEHPVLDFLNTLVMTDGTLVDQLQTDADVVGTLARLGWPTDFKGAGLLETARLVREEIRGLLAREKAGKPLGLERLNKTLQQSASHLRLSRSAQGSLIVSRIWECRTPEQALAPVAEAAAELLTSKELTLIRRCASETCTLWFYDRTKSHQRRWCSTETCGNRYKVAAFRKRHKGSAAS